MLPNPNQEQNQNYFSFQLQTGLICDISTRSSISPIYFLYINIIQLFTCPFYLGDYFAVIIKKKKKGKEGVWEFDLNPSNHHAPSSPS